MSYPGGGYPGQNPYGGAPQPGYYQAAPAYGQPQPGAYGQPQPGAYGQPQPGYGQPQPGAYGQQPGGYGRPGAPPQQHGGPPPGVNPEIYSWFRAVDQDNSGFINAQELSRALQSGNNRNFSIQACSTMMGMFDHSRSGRIDVNQFSQLFAFINQWTDAFKNADKDNSGSINANEITAVLQQQGYNLTPQTIQVMIQKYGAAAGGPYGGGQTTLGLDGFILVNSQLRKLTEVFRQKDTQMQGRVTLSYEEFVGMAMSATV